VWDSRRNGKIDTTTTVRDSGYTLIELLLVVLVLGILSTVVIFSISGMRTEAAESGCGSDSRILGTATETYFAEVGGSQIAPTGIGDDRFEQTLVDGGFLRVASAYYELDAGGVITPQEGSPC
jgi:prepilin-type N-terminal cleavage/methylation domain-containing protein